ncbi:hypothetical protein NX021_02605 [Cytobacillus firmus]|nr:hypothetical protein [Cytobacillus firmus]
MSNRNSKYDPLQNFLKFQKTKSIKMTFLEVEDILGFTLPKSAYEHEAWWDKSDTHTQSFAWKNADFIAKPNLKEKKVEFVKPIED